MNQEAKLDYLIDYLSQEQGSGEGALDVKSLATLEKVEKFRALCNVREPKAVSDEFLAIQDSFLKTYNNERKHVSLADLTEIRPQQYVWQGDITTLSVDAIVNAANSRFIGCMEPNHDCIDNIIHTRAGVQLRLDCEAIIQAQGRKEPVGKAKITKGYNLPAKYVIHTVGPYIDQRGVSPLKEQLLASSYKASIALADEKGLESIAFCCISTGVFNFPNERAAEIAVQTVENYLMETNSNIKVIYNVFKPIDLTIYQSILQ